MPGAGARKNTLLFHCMQVCLMKGAVCRTEAREDLRNQVGNLRFDLNTLIESSSKSKADKKAATQLKKDFLIKVGPPRASQLYTLFVVAVCPWISSLSMDGMLLGIAEGLNAVHTTVKCLNASQQAGLTQDGSQYCDAPEC